jgi:tetratricopeptide (TPR) repeat protein
MAEMTFVHRKTQIALEYAYRLKERPPLRSIFWVYASSVARFEEAYQRIARECQIPGHQDPKADQMQLVRDWLEAKHDLPWLMIIDNVDDGRVIFGKTTSGKCLLEYVPQSSQGFVIYTTRNRDIGVDLVGDPIDVSVMDLAEAQTLLHKKLATGVTPMEEQEFLEEMGYLPIAVTQAASFMSKRRISISQYLTLFRQSDTNRTKLISHQFTGHGRESRPMESAAKTWMVSFQYIKGQNTRASDILTIMSFLDRNAIPNSLLVNDNEEQLDFLEAMALLEAFSLVHRKTDSYIHDMHRLVQLATRAWIREDGDEDRWAFLALLILSKRFPYGDYEHWKTCAIYFPHADMILRYDFHGHRNEVSTAQATLLSNMSRYLREQGSYDTSVEKAKKSVKLREEVLGPEHPETLTSLDNLARALESQGDFRSAEVVARRTLRARAHLLGPEHEDSLVSSETLARVLSMKGEYDAAEHLSRLVVAGRTKVLGPEHRHTLSMIFFTGWMLNYQSKYESAKAQISQALSLQKKSLGDDHPDTLKSLSGLAITELDLGDGGRAESLLRDALSRAKRVFGEEHPETYDIMGNLAIVLSAKSQYEEAETLNRKCLQWKETILGDHHPETLATLHNLAVDLGDQGKHGQAEGILRQTLKRGEEVLGQKHPDTLTSMNYLAWVLRDQGKYSEAEELYRQTLKEREEVLGQKHPDTLTSMNDLALVLRDQAVRQRSCIDKRSKREKKF